MDGICGFFHLDGKPADVDRLDRLRVALIPNPALRLRRADGATAGPVALGTVAWGGQADLASEQALCRDPGSGCVVVADARLDERAELASELGLRRNQDGSMPGQAELILQAWLRWREACPEHLLGDFAFAIWDPRQQSLFCARDIMGVRPLHVHHQPGRLFAFASRARALLTLPDVPHDLDEGRIADALVQQLEGVDKRCTFYRAILRLPPAHSLSIRAQHYRERQYWQLQPRMDGAHRSNDAWAEGLIEVLERAVSRHLVGLTKVGSMLSGGMDSSSLAVIAADQLIRAGRPPLATFSSVNADPECLETAAIRSMLELPGFAPTLIDPAVIAAQHEALVHAAWHSDEPFDCIMLLLHAQYHNAALAGVEAVIDGIDGDMLFARGQALLRQLRHFEWFDVWRNVRGFRRLYPDDHPWRDLLRLSAVAFIPAPARRWLRRHPGPDSQAEAIGSSLIRADFAHRIDLGARLQRLEAWLAPGNFPDASSQATRALQHPFTTCGIERYHRVAAWHGVDPRHPFADRQVLEYCVNLPDRQRVANGYSKAVLRHAMRDRLPPEVCWRSDKTSLGWGLASRCLLGDAADVERRLAQSRPLLEPWVDMAKLDLAVQRFRQSGRYDSGVSLFEVLSLGAWLQLQTADAG